MVESSRRVKVLIRRQKTVLDVWPCKAPPKLGLQAVAQNHVPKLATRQTMAGNGFSILEIGGPLAEALAVCWVGWPSVWAVDRQLGWLTIDWDRLAPPNRTPTDPHFKGSVMAYFEDAESICGLGLAHLQGFRVVQG